MSLKIEDLSKKVLAENIWDDGPVYCFTSDIDWASEAVLNEYFKTVNDLDIKPTVFVTHHSNEIENNFKQGKVERGLHPNFLNGSSHGDSFKEIAETVVKMAPEAYGFRSHRCFEVTDVTHMMKNDYGFKYISNVATIMHPNIKPMLHESGLVRFPIFLEDGTHLYNQLDYNILKYQEFLTSPGLKVICFHPMNFVFNSPSIKYMRQIKDSLSREEFINISKETINDKAHYGKGVRSTILDMVEFVKKKNYPVYSMNELYKLIEEK